MEEQNKQSTPILTSDNLQVPQSIHSEAPQNAEATEGKGAVEPIETHVLTDDEAVAVAQAVIKPQVMQGQVVVEKRPEGRPTKYNDGMLQRAKSYLKTCTVQNKLPLIEELARILEIDDETISEWCNVNPEFSATIKRLRLLQKEKIILRGFGAKNPTFSIFMLKANHGMMETEKQVLVQDRDVKVSITRE